MDNNFVLNNFYKNKEIKWILTKIKKYNNGGFNLK